MPYSYPLIGVEIYEIANLTMIQKAKKVSKKLLKGEIEKPRARHCFNLLYR